MYANTPHGYLAREAHAMDLRRMAAEAGTPYPHHDRAVRLDLVWQNRDARHYGPRYPMGMRLPG